MSEIDMTPQRLHTIKARLGLTWPELAAKTGYSLTHIEAMYGGRRKVSERLVLLLEKIIKEQKRAKKNK